MSRKSNKKVRSEYDEWSAPTPQRADPRREARRNKMRKTRIAVLAFVLIAIMIAGAVTAAAAFVTYSKAVFPNIFINGIRVGGLKGEQVAEVLEKAGWDVRASSPLNVTLLDKTTFEVDQCLSGAIMSKEKAAEAAIVYGHSGNWYLNLEKYLKNLVTPVDVKNDAVVLDEGYIRAQIDNGVDQLNKALGEGGYEFDKERSVMCFVKGAGDVHFDKDALFGAISQALISETTQINYNTLTQEPAMPDFELLHTELAREPVNAHFSDDNRFTVIEDVDGVEFDIYEAQRLWNEAKTGTKVEIPMTLTYPEIRAADLEALLFRDVLGERTTYFPNSNDNRINNLVLASGKVNNYILYPGDIFSYNDVVGERTEEAGFLPAGAYSSGEVVEEVGGGVCQVSSTIYNAMLYGYKLTTVERSPHYFPSDYIEKGLDATVSWPKPHFKFRNDRDYPIKIVAECDTENRALTVKILGTNLEGTFIQLRTSVAGYNNSKYTDLFEGYGAQTFRDVYDSYGNQIDMISEIYDIYHTHEFVEAYKAREANEAAALAAAGIYPNAF